MHSCSETEIWKFAIDDPSNTILGAVPLPGPNFKSVFFENLDRQAVDCD